jgi:hypothetical protein
VNGFFSLWPAECNGIIGLFYVFPKLDLSRLQDFLAVSYVTAPGDAVRWQARPSFLPVITAGQGPVFLDDKNAVHQMMRPDFDATKVLYLPMEIQPLVSVTHPTAARIISQRFERQQVELEVESQEPSLVVIAQSYYPCWRAYADDRPVPLLRANYAFQAMQVPAGTHRLRLTYEDRAFQFGVVLSSLTLLGCAAYVLKTWRWSRKGEVLAGVGSPA